MRPQALQIMHQLMFPWFALFATSRRTRPGIWKQHSTRSQTQLAHGLFGTPPIWSYTKKTRCPKHGGLLRIHSHASTSTPNHAPVDAPMVCPVCHIKTNKARNMEAAQHKEPNSTCPRSVWDATNLVVHQENKVPKTWRAAENTQPCVHKHSKSCTS